MLRPRIHRNSGWRGPFKPMSHPPPPPSYWALGAGLTK